MKIRWQGLIGFVVVSTLIFAGWYIFADGIIRRAIERAGTEAVGAMVELEDADLTLFPLGLTLTGLEVTNPDEPMTNAVEVKRIAFLIDPGRALERKVIVEELTADGIRFNTPRERSGAVDTALERASAGVKEKAEEVFAMPSFDLPDIRAVLSKEGLKSLELAEALKRDIEADRKRWEGEMKGLLDKEKIASYKQRIEKLKGSKSGGVAGLIGGAAEAKKLQEEISGEIERARKLNTELQQGIKSYKARIEEARKAPSEDIKRLKEKYSLTPEGLSNISRNLFGARLGGSVDKGLGWYRRLAPYLGGGIEKVGGKEVVRPVRMKGVNVRFTEREPTPEFLIRKAALSVSIPAGEIAGTVRDITPDQKIIGRPLTFDFSGEKLEGLDSIKLSGALDHSDPTNISDTASFDMKGLRLEKRELSVSKELPLVLETATADLTIDAGFKGEAMDTAIKAAFGSVRVDAAVGADAGKVAKAFGEAIEGIRKFGVEAVVSGTIDDHKLSVSTDLDRVLKKALGKFVKDQAAGFEKELKAGILAKTDGPLGEMLKSYGGVESLGGESAGRLKQGDGLMEELAGGATGGILPGGVKLPF
ncbi:MAG: TIGR03545 family protein [Thermodesulfobacteriota bacterium]